VEYPLLGGLDVQVASRQADPITDVQDLFLAMKDQG
jgi:hypothetical protein